jgi:hypothetical protein
MKKATEIKEVETWEELCEAIGIDPVQSLAWAEQLPEERRPAMIAVFRFTELTNYYWGEIVASFKDSGQEKWFPVFYGRDSTEPSGFGFSHSLTFYVLTYTFVGARLSYPTKKLSDSSAKNFLSWYRDFMVVETPNEPTEQTKP